MKKFIFFAATSVIIGISILLITTISKVDKEDQDTGEINKENLKGIKNVILIIACSLRADHLGCYGYERKTSPNIDRLAEAGITFKNCFVQAPYTVHSVSSIITSKYPRKLLGLNFINHIPDQAKTFAELFKKEGFYTLGFMANPWTSKLHNYHQGFDYFFDTSDLLTRYKTELNRLDNRVWGTELVSRIINKLKETKGKFFVQTLFIDIHWPYTSFPPFRGKYTLHNQEASSLAANRLAFDVNRYDEAILNFDSHIGNLVEELRALNLLDSTLLIITSDHGEEFGKLHEYDLSHGGFLYNTVIKTPLIFYSPSLSPKGVIVGKYVTSMDILPTVLDLVGIPYDCESFDGISQKNVFHGSVATEKSERLIVSETNFLKKARGMIRSCAIFNQRWKIIYNYETNVKNRKLPVYELYNLQKDPKELNNLFNQKKNITEKLILLLQNWQRENTPQLPNDMIEEGYTVENIDPEIKRQLKTLGYIK